MEDDAVGLDGVLGFGRASKSTQHEAADGVEVLVVEVEVEVFVYLGDGDAAVHGVDAVPDLLDGSLALVELVLDLAHYLLEDVLYRYEALHAPPLVYDDSHLKLASLELPQDLLYGLVLRNDETVPDDAPDVEVLRFFLGRPEEILDVDRAENVVEVIHVDRVSRVAPEGRLFGQLRERGIVRERLDVRPGDHDLAGDLVPEVEDVVEVVLLLGLELAGGDGRGDHDPQLLLRVGLHPLAEPDTPGPQDEVRRGVDQPHQRAEEEHEQLERAADPERSPFGLLDREVLGRLLPEDQVRVGYDREPQDYRYQLEEPLVGYPHRFEPRAYKRGDRRFSDPPETKGGDGDPDLADGEIGVEVVQGVSHRPGLVATLLFELHEARLPHPHQRKLRRDEKAV